MGAVHDVYVDRLSGWGTRSYGSGTWCLCWQIKRVRNKKLWERYMMFMLTDWAGEEQEAMGAVHDVYVDRLSGWGTRSYGSGTWCLCWQIERVRNKKLWERYMMFMLTDWAGEEQEAMGAVHDVYVDRLSGWGTRSYGSGTWCLCWQIERVRNKKLWERYMMFMLTDWAGEEQEAMGAVHDVYVDRLSGWGTRSYGSGTWCLCWQIERVRNKKLWERYMMFMLTDWAGEEQEAMGAIHDVYVDRLSGWGTRSYGSGTWCLCWQIERVRNKKLWERYMMFMLTDWAGEEQEAMGAVHDVYVDRLSEWETRSYGSGTWCLCWQIERVRNKKLLERYMMFMLTDWAGEEQEAMGAVHDVYVDRLSGWGTRSYWSGTWCLCWQIERVRNKKLWERYMMFMLTDWAGEEQEAIGAVHDVYVDRLSGWGTRSYGSGTWCLCWQIERVRNKKLWERYMMFMLTDWAGEEQEAMGAVHDVYVDRLSGWGTRSYGSGTWCLCWQIERVRNKKLWERYMMFMLTDWAGEEQEAMGAVHDVYVDRLSGWGTRSYGSGTWCLCWQIERVRNKKLWERYMMFMLTDWAGEEQEAMGAVHDVYVDRLSGYGTRSYGSGTWCLCWQIERVRNKKLWERYMMFMLTDWAGEEQEAMGAVHDVYVDRLSGWGTWSYGSATWCLCWQIERVRNKKLWERYTHRQKEVAEENHGSDNERRLFHGSAFINAIVHKGFDERHAYIGGMFGAGQSYFARISKIILNICKPYKIDNLIFPRVHEPK